MKSCLKGNACFGSLGIIRKRPLKDYPFYLYDWKIKAFTIFGICRIGKDIENSVVCPDLKSCELRNLIVTDVSVFLSSGGRADPLLTIDTLYLTAAHLMVENLNKG